MKYKVGDKVRVKSLEWYNENKNNSGSIHYSDSSVFFVSNMSKFCGSIVTIKDIDIDLGAYKVEENTMLWIDGMFEENVEETSLKGEFGLWENKINDILFSNENYADKVELCLGDDYEIVVEGDKTFVQRKKPKYPKSFQECYYLLYGQQDLTLGCDIMRGAHGNLLECLQMLLICRDVYWKIADNWKPDYNNDVFYTIKYNGTHIRLYNYTEEYAILSFSTEEMRDAFYENFKDLIENCKELL